MERLVVTPNDAAEMLATSPNKIYEMLEAGVLPAYKQGSYWKIPVHSLQEYVISKAHKEAKERRNKWQK